MRLRTAIVSIVWHAAPNFAHPVCVLQNKLTGLQEVAMIVMFVVLAMPTQGNFLDCAVAHNPDYKLQPRSPLLDYFGMSIVKR